MERLVSSQTHYLEEEDSLRPSSLREYIGQSTLKQNLEVFIQAARSRNEALDHVLLYGPPGLGKTTLSYILANEMDGNLKTASGPAIEKPGDLAAILSTLQPGDVYLLMKFIVYHELWKKFYILRWRIIVSILWWGKKIMRHVQFVLIYHHLH